MIFRAIGCAWSISSAPHEETAVSHAQLELAAARDRADETAAARQAFEARLRDADAAIKVPPGLLIVMSAGITASPAVHRHTGADAHLLQRHYILVLFAPRLTWHAECDDVTAAGWGRAAVRRARGACGEDVDPGASGR